MIYVDCFLLCLLFILTLFILLLKWRDLANFYHKNYSFFDVFFILIYSFEQILFLILYYFSEFYRGLWVSGIVLIICLTLMLDKWLLRRQHAKTVNIRFLKEKKLILNYVKTLEFFKTKIEKLEVQRKDLIDYSIFLERKIEKLKKHGSK